jgi:hypothetical protein
MAYVAGYRTKVYLNGIGRQLSDCAYAAGRRGSAGTIDEASFVLNTALLPSMAGLRIGKDCGRRPENDDD